jgi:membrane-associated protein
MPPDSNNLLAIFDVKALIEYGGLLLAFLLVFGSTGLFFCFFIPSGAVLFAVGMLTATGDLDHSIFTVCLILFVASFSGNIAGYWFGLKAGPLLYKKKDSRFFRQQHLVTAESFYKKYGKWALTVGLYLPIVRTFASIVAGIIRLPFQQLLLLTGIGSFAWILSFVLLGYMMGKIPFLKSWSSYIIVGFLLVVTIPLLFKVIKEFKTLRKENEKKG